MDKASMIRIYHNPRCSKSREALALVERFAHDNALPLEIVEYLKTPPSAAELEGLCRELGTDARAIVRANEDEFTTLCLSEACDAALLQAIAEHPKLLQRPIVSYRGRALVARPPELLQDFLTNA